MRALPAFLVLLASLSAGCLDAGGGGSGEAPGPTSFEALDDCGTPVFGGIQGREVDVAVDPNDRSRVAAAAMLTPPTMRDVPAEGDVSLWNALARSDDCGPTWRTTFTCVAIEAR